MDCIASFQSLIEQAETTFQRRLCVFAGQPQWGVDSLACCLESVSSNVKLFDDACWVGDSIPSCMGHWSLRLLKPAKVNQSLGTSTSLLIVNLHEGFNPDALAAITGTLAGGGFLILLCPELEDWPGFADPDYQRMLVYPQQLEAVKGRFLHRFSQSLVTEQTLLLISEQKGTREPVFSDLTAIQQVEHAHAEDICINADQRRLVEQIKHSVRRAHRPLVIRADRGRGKSSALGIAAGELMQSAPVKILLAAPRAVATGSVMAMVAKRLPALKRQGNALLYKDSSFVFMAPDEIIHWHTEADVLLVDEAAAIPIPMLQQLLKRFSRIVFASTVHGYEGTGRGFDIRFSKILDQYSPNWSRSQLVEPVRWAANDPVERWLNHSLLLDVEIPELGQVTREDLASAPMRAVSQDVLLADSALLTQVFALLVEAHYRTTPGDLRDLLDGSLQLWVQELSKGGTQVVVGALLVAIEGDLPDELSQSIWAGRRRPRGHLLPQILCAQAGYLEAAALRYLRVVRIAVHPEVQSRGLGSQMLEHLTAIGAELEVDALGATFAASADLLSFWQDNHYQALRIGVSRDANSGSYTAIVAKPITGRADELLARIQTDFYQQLQLQLTSVWQEVEADLVALLLRQSQLSEPDQQQLKDIASFVYGFRGFDQVVAALAALVVQLLQHPQYSAQLSVAEVQLLVSRILQYQPWAVICSELGLSGKKEAVQRIKSILTPFVTETLNNRNLGDLIAQLQSDEND